MIKQVKTKKLSYRLGNLEHINIPNDWRKCNGISARRTETNSGLSQRDYSIKCKYTNELMVVEGFWIWWCDTHNHPESWCKNDKFQIKIKELEKKINTALRSLGEDKNE